MENKKNQEYKLLEYGNKDNEYLYTIEDKEGNQLKVKKSFGDMYQGLERFSLNKFYKMDLNWFAKNETYYMNNIVECNDSEVC